MQIIKNNLKIGNLNKISKYLETRQQFADGNLEIAFCNSLTSKTPNFKIAHSKNKSFFQEQKLKTSKMKKKNEKRRDTATMLSR